MSTRVNIEASAWGNKRFALLAKYLGFVDSDHALIKCAVLWSWQTENFTSEAPTYVVDADTIDVCLGRDGAAAAMVKAGLAEEGPNGYRICGSEGRIEWLSRCRESSVKGVAAKRAKADSGRNQWVNPPVNHPVDDCNTANNRQPPGQPGATPGSTGGSTTPSTLFTLSSGRRREETRIAGSGSRANQPRSSAAQVIAHWNARFEKARGTRPFWPAAIQRLVDGLVGSFSVEEICARINTAFDAPPKWPEGPYDFATFARHFDKFLRGNARGGPAPGIRVIQTRAERERAALEAAEHDEESA